MANEKHMQTQKTADHWDLYSLTKEYTKETD